MVAAFAGCGDSSAPSAIEGTYQLTLLNGQELPYDQNGVGCCIYLSGFLELDGGNYTASITARNRNSDTTFTALEWGKYAREPFSLTFVLDSFDVSPLGLATGSVSADTARVGFGGEGPGSPDQFQGLFVRVFQTD